jgi:hypothetical protein
MEESLPAAGTPEETAAVEEKLAREPRRRFRLPTSVIITVLVAAFSVWVAPAFTRQWDDRQKARELQAEVADQIGIASAETAGGLVALVESNRRPQDVQRLRQEWLVNRFRIEARLKAYFPGARVTEVWADYVTLVEGLTTLALSVSDPGISPRARRESVRRTAARLHAHVNQYISPYYQTGFENPQNASGHSVGG